jgi:hypothetical protein
LNNKVDKKVTIVGEGIDMGQAELRKAGEIGSMDMEV